MEVSFHNKVKASIILIACLFLSSMWYFYYGTSDTFTHPWVFRIADGLRSPFTTKMYQFWTSFHPILCLALIPIAQRICPRMYFWRLGDLWIYYYVYFFVLAFDFMLTYRTGDFRVATTIVFILLQSSYLIHSVFKR